MSSAHRLFDLLGFPVSAWFFKTQKTRALKFRGWFWLLAEGWLRLGLWIDLALVWGPELFSGTLFPFFLGGCSTGSLFSRVRVLSSEPWGLGVAKVRKAEQRLAAAEAKVAELEEERDPFDRFIGLEIDGFHFCGAFCWAVWTLVFCQLMGFPLTH